MHAIALNPGDRTVGRRRLAWMWFGMRHYYCRYDVLSPAYQPDGSQEVREFCRENERYPDFHVEPTSSSTNSWRMPYRQAL